MSKHTALGSFLIRIRAASVRLLVVALAVTGLAASAWAWFAPAGKAERSALATKAEPAPPAAPARTSSGQERVEAEVITLGPTGFEPAEIRRPAGRALLAVDNESGLEEAVIRLTRADGQLLHEARIPRRQKKWRQVFDFTPGVYTLTVVDRSEWSCSITIE
jgi:hypothetical protein